MQANPRSSCHQEAEQAQRVNPTHPLPDPAPQRVHRPHLRAASRLHAQSSPLRPRRSVPTTSHHGRAQTPRQVRQDLRSSAANEYGRRRDLSPQPPGCAAHAPPAHAPQQARQCPHQSPARPRFPEKNLQPFPHSSRSHLLCNFRRTEALTNQLQRLLPRRDCSPQAVHPRLSSTSRETSAPACNRQQSGPRR